MTERDEKRQTAPPEEGKASPEESGAAPGENAAARVENGGAPGEPDIDRARFERHLERSDYYSYPGPPDSFEVGSPQWRGPVTMTELRFKSPLPSGVPDNDAAFARFFRRSGRDGGQPIVFLHGLGPSWLFMWESFAAALASRGFPTLLLCLPYLCERRAPGVPRGYAYMSTSAVTALPAYEQAVADARAALDWLLTGPFAGRGLGVERPGPAVLGVSLGALVAVIAAAMEPRFQSLVSVLGGGDLDIIVFKGGYRTPVQRELDNARIRIENRRRARLAYSEYLEEIRRAPHPLDVEAPFHFFLFDPLTFAHHLRHRPVLMINALFDPIIPRAAANQLWLELGKPPSSWFWGTHWAGGPWNPFVIWRITRFLRGLSANEIRTPAGSVAQPWVP